MKGIRLSSLSGELHKVEEKDSKNPAATIAHPLKKLSGHIDWIADGFDKPQNFHEYYYQLPLNYLEGFSFDELCKLKFSSPVMMEKSVREFFEQNVRHEVVRKIVSSMWRWGFVMDSWNEVVDAYNCLRNFVFSPNPEFEVRLDYTTYTNEFGHSKCSRVFLDGALGYLVHYKGIHVMTIGFSLAGNRKILIQQIQSAQRNGNRYLYQLPSNRLEFVLGLFRHNFPGFDVYLIDGDSLVEKTLTDYRNSLKRSEHQIKEYRPQTNRPGDAGAFAQKMLTMYLKDQKAFRDRIDHLEKDRERIVDFYVNTGRFKRGRKLFSAFRMTHHLILRKERRVRT